MTDTSTTHVAEVAVPGQSQVTVRLSCGELEIGQEYDHGYHTISVQPDNVLRLVRAMLVMVGLDDCYLYQQRAGSGLCHDVDWPDDGPLSPREVAMINARPDIDWKAVLEDANQLEAEAVLSGPEAETKSKDRTAAERMRRYRARRRNSDRNSGREGVTAEPELKLIAAE